MGRVLLCVGRRAITPYSFPGAGIKVYSLEELCYFFGENAFLLDESLASKNLARWLEEECELPELAAALYPFVGKKGAAEYFVDTILNYSGYFKGELKEQVFTAVKESSGRSVGERKKSRADFLLKNGKYELAVREYNLILEQQEIDDRLLGGIYLGLGKAYANLFLFRSAADMLEKAYLMQKDEESAFAFLAAKRLYVEDGKYIAFIAEHPELYDVSMRVERVLNEANRMWEVSAIKKQLDDLKECKGAFDSQLYYSEIDRMSGKLKDEYRKCAQE